MSKITLKKSSVAGKVPVVEDLEYGELALNYADGALYYKSSANTIENLVQGGTTSIAGSFGITIDGGGSPITAGVKGYISIPYNCTITGWDIVADVSGSIVVDLWKSTYDNYPPTVSNSIAGTEKPSLVSSIKNKDQTLTSWTTTVSAGDVVAFYVESASIVKRVHITVNTLRT
jgi:hypothetical protein